LGTWGLFVEIEPIVMDSLSVALYWGLKVRYVECV